MSHTLALVVMAGFLLAAAQGVSVKHILKPGFMD
jgi:hypothetical protein